jgi:hypothetical protein
LSTEEKKRTGEEEEEEEEEALLENVPCSVPAIRTITKTRISKANVQNNYAHILFVHRDKRLVGMLRLVCLRHFLNSLSCGIKCATENNLPHGIDSCA